MLSTYAWIACGGALGSVARFIVSNAFARLVGENFPWGTVIVNITGSLAIGFLAAATGPHGKLMVSPDARRFMMIGVCGGYTTFSSFSLQTLNLIRLGETVAAAANVALSVVACMLAVWAGATLGQTIGQPRG